MKTLGALLLSTILISCAATPRNPYVVASDAPVWPAQPEVPRVQYVTSIQRHNDLFESGGFLASVIRIAAGDEDTAMVRPYAVAIHPEGGVIVTDPGVGYVHFYDSARRRYRALGRDMPGGLTSPVGVAVADSGEILISDSRRRSIERFDRNGRSLGTFAGPDVFQRPGGVAINRATGELFAADVPAHTILVFDPSGKVKRVIGKNGAEPGQFNFPTHVSIDSRGDLLVSDSMNFRIQRLTTEGEPLAEYGEVGNARGDFARPKGVGAVSDHVYVAVEGLFDSMIFFAPTGELLLSVGEAGSEPGHFWLPAGLAVDRQRNLIFVADSYNSRIQVFRMMGLGGVGGSP